LTDYSVLIGHGAWFDQPTMQRYDITTPPEVAEDVDRYQYPPVAVDRFSTFGSTPQARHRQTIYFSNNALFACCNTAEAGRYTVTILDSRGRTISVVGKTFTSPGSTARIATDALTPGVYFARLAVNKELQSAARFVVK
jgi:hypothetical protein